MRQSRIQTIQENCMHDIHKTTLRVVPRKVGGKVTLGLRLFLLKHKQISFIKRTRFLHGPFAIVHLACCFIELHEFSSFTHGFINACLKSRKVMEEWRDKYLGAIMWNLRFIFKGHKNNDNGKAIWNYIVIQNFSKKILPFAISFQTPHYDLNSGEGNLI